ncbi:uncharacterized protein LOC5512020 isoform X1 [Nematostella vectensis]|uniref:uncharacterized protein LOC5512020 isoform X1 n=1 Tax=Nematostella vectensis TaxID=45351 RepID=UPI0020774A68|nr:uncharacterized protein LOC5512020 isoform X1 [Nematostella vectensis]
MMPTIAAPTWILLLLVACYISLCTAQIYQRRVCPTVLTYKSHRECKGTVHLCNSDDECSPGERCCPQENECPLKCRKTVITKGCPIPIDLALLLDSSGSIGRRNWVKVQKFAKSIVDIYDISEQGTHFAIIAYSTSAVVEIAFNKYTGVERNAVNIKRDIDEFKLQRGLTFIDKALALADSKVFTVEGGMRTDRKKVALVLTDGIQTKDRGPFTPPGIASGPLKMKGVEVYSLGVGSDIEVLELITMASSDINVYSARNFDELETKVADITQAQCKACDQRVDVVFGIPDSSDLGLEFDNIKKFYTRLAGLLTISNRLAHVGIVRYSDTADMILPLDESYYRDSVVNKISNIKLSGTSGVDPSKAIQVAADQAFTMFGGVRQVVPKTFVLFMPREATVDRSVVEKAVAKLKSIGVRLMTVGLNKVISKDRDMYNTLSSQPKIRYVLSGFDHPELGIAAYEAADTICKGRYGKCPAYKPGLVAECPAGGEKDGCSVDSDCASKDDMCCEGDCGERKCTPRVKNCFITMDVALVIDSSAAVSDEDFEKVKKFAIRIVHGIADAENSIHFGLVQYGEKATTIVDFNKIMPNSALRETIKALTKNNDPTRRVDLTLETVKKDLFSLEGGMRQGHPRFVVFITAGGTDAASKDLAVASKPLRDLGVNIIALGINSGVDKAFLNSLATKSSLAFSASSADQLGVQREAVEKAMCSAKPGKCPPPFSTGFCPDITDVPSDQVPCGPSINDPKGKSNDWECPGEQKCCLDIRQGCFSVCTDPPLYCEGQYDLTLLIENSDDVGADGFNKLKTFAKDLTKSFSVADYNTRVSVITYGGPAKVEFTLSSLGASSLRQKVNQAIDALKFSGGAGGGVSNALEKAVSDIYTAAGGSRDSANKSLIIIGSGKVENPAGATNLANQLRQAQVDIFAMPVGEGKDLAALKTIASKKVEKNIFVTSSYLALKAHLRALTEAVCEGAEKLRPCDLPLDIVFGIPTASSLEGDFKKIKNTFTSLLKFFKVNNRKAHLGIVEYSDDARMTKPLDQEYDRKELIKVIDEIQPSGNGFNVAAAMKRASDHAFTIFGGVRQTVPKTFVLFVPRDSTADMAEVNKQAQALKAMGVHIVLFAVDKVTNLDKWKTIASQPARRFFIGNTFDDIAGQIYDAKETICKGRYGKCPPSPPPSCADPEDSCALDSDCPGDGQKCCAGGAGCGRSCQPPTDTCFVNADVAFAIDNSAAVTDGDLTKVKTFVKDLIHALVGSENSMHISVSGIATIADVKANFRALMTEADLKAAVDSITASSNATNYGEALKGIKEKVFSLEGAMRQGHPRYTVVLSGSGPGGSDWQKAAQTLKDMDWMNVIGVGVNSGVPDDFLSSLSSSGLNFKANSPDDLSNIRGQVEKAFCNPKPGKCPPGPAGECKADPPPRYIPCGASAGGSSDSDWPCPGEQKCCRVSGDAGECFSVCQEPPNECKGTHDLTLLLESNDEVGPEGFEKVKTFAKQLVSAFDISDKKTRVSVVTYGASAKANFRFNTIAMASKDKILDAIDKLRHVPGGASSTGSALETAFNDVYKPPFGSRDDANKSLVIISQGKFSDPNKAARHAYQLRLDNVDVFQVAVGGGEDLPSVRRVVSHKHDKTVFMTSSYDALKPHLRAVTQRVCEGAEKLKPCDRPLDIVYGIPVASGANMREVKLLFNSLTRRFVVNNRAVHIGLMPYSDTAILDTPIDGDYDASSIMKKIDMLKPQGNGYNVARAITVAADHAFTIFGGTRQTSPKTLVLMVPGAISGEAAAVRAAADKLKGMGVRLMVFGLDGQADKGLLSGVSTQPTRKFLPFGSYDYLIAATEAAADTICAGKYGKCPKVPPPAECPDKPSNTCQVDMDCANEGEACCSTGCPGSTACTKSFKNCFVNMDIAFAIDTTGDVAETQKFVKQLVNNMADSENSIHFGILTYGEKANTVTNFRDFQSEAKIKELVDGIASTPGGRRTDVALRQVKTDLFSLEGGMRQGHPKYAIVVTSGATAAGSEDLAKASKDLRELGVKVVVVAANSGADDSDFAKLASDPELVFKPDGGQLSDLAVSMTKKLCNAKPGTCPPTSGGGSCASVRAEAIPCGESIPGKEGRADKVNDWDCPGEQRCCKDDNGCSVCRHPPNECKGQYDLAILLDASADIGETGFEYAKTFAKQLASAFDVSSNGAQIALISYGASAKADFSLKRYKDKDQVLKAIDNVPYQGGASATSEALRTALSDVFPAAKGAREGVNKSLVIISTGRFQNPAAAISLAGQLKLQQVDVFAVPVGNKPDLATLRNVVSRKEEKNVFMTTSPEALRPHLRAVTDTICAGAEKIKVCDKKMDVMFGIPTATELGDSFQKVKDFYSNMVKLFKVSNRHVHVGLIPYSNTASMTQKLDSIYDRPALLSAINDLRPSGSGYNVADALRVAADHAFTIFGGVRQTAPKTFVLFLPGDATGAQEEINAAAQKLKSMGVRLMIAELKPKDAAVNALAASQPPRKHHLTGDFDAINAAVYDAVNTICKAKYGKCPAFPPPKPAECPPDQDDECSVDEDCEGPEDVCCAGGCGRECRPRVKNCFVAMDIAIAVDSSASVPDDEFENVKNFVTRIVNSNSDSENSIHFGVLQFGAETKTLTSFQKFASEAKLRDLIKGMQKLDGDRKFDTALKGIRKDIFSLEGRMRQGRPRFAIVITSGASAAVSAELAKASKELTDIGVKIIAVGTNAGVGDDTLRQLATEPNLKFTANKPEDFRTLWNDIEKQMCSPKPGKCPPSPPSGGSCGDAPPEEIPCGESVAGKEGRTDKENDWDCPGEQRCCKSDDGCHSVCKEPPNVCNGQFDLTLLLDTSDDVTEKGFKKVQTFAKNLVDAFNVGDMGTRVSLISYGEKPKLDLKLTGISGVNSDKVKNAIDRVRFGGGGASSTADALEVAVKEVYTDREMRPSANKSLVIISTGKFQNPAKAARLAGALKQAQVDVFAVPVGENPDIPALKKIVSHIVDNNVFMTSSYDALRPHLRSLTKTICDGAEKLKECKIPMDVVYGIPVSNSLGPDFDKVKDFFTSMTKQFGVSNRLTHVGLVPYSNNARLAVALDKAYDKNKLIETIENLKPSGSGFNIGAALRVATDHAFTMFGGVRQTAPKTFVLYVPDKADTPRDAIEAAVKKLKSIGVRLMIVGIKDRVDKAAFSTLSTQPPRKHLLHGGFDEVGAQVYDAVETICKARYGKCPAYPPPAPPECPPEAKDECATDGECQGDDVCCVGGCARECRPQVKNCFVTMDVAIAIDNSASVSDEDLEAEKKFATQVVNSISSAENSIHYGVLQFADSSQTLANFNGLKTDSQIRQLIKDIKKSAEPSRRIDVALKQIKRDIFSLEGGMRQGHPRHVIVITAGDSSPDSEDLATASKGLRELGVKIVSVGINSNVETAFLTSLASEDRLAFKASSPEELKTLWSRVEKELCSVKPGQCPPAKSAECGSEIPASDIPCGDSVAGKEGRSEKENDWDCPGETRCCADGCGRTVCREPPNECAGKFDITLVLDSSNAVGLDGFNKVKTFAGQLVDAFNIGDTKFAVITSGKSTKIDFMFNTLKGGALSKDGIKSRIEFATFQGGDAPDIGRGLGHALDEVFKTQNGARLRSKKRLVIIGSGKMTDAIKAAAIASKLKQDKVGLYAVPVGGQGDLPAIKKIVSDVVEKNVFMTSSYDALRPHLRALTNAICLGPVDIKACDVPMDIVFGIPTSGAFKPQLETAKSIFGSMLRQFNVNNRKVHVGLIKYGDRAEMPLHLDTEYNRDKIQSEISNLQSAGLGVDVASAIKLAADNAFTVFGGVRQTVPKTFVLFVPGKASVPNDVIAGAAAKLKSMGVRLLVLALEGADKDLYKLSASQPTRKFLVHGNADVLGANLLDTVETVCKGRYGKCPAFPPPASNCSTDGADECAVDQDCKAGEVCCESGCASGNMICRPVVKNCFVTMDVALAVDTSDGMSDADLAKTKSLVTTLVNQFSDSENSIRFGITTYGQEARTLANFKQNFDEAKLRTAIKGIQKTGVQARRHDLAAMAVKNDLFSLEGGMRQGHPRFVIFFSAGANTGTADDLKKASKPLTDLGVNMIAIGVNSNADQASLAELASENRFIFSANSPAELDALWPSIEAQMCQEKPGKCPPSPPSGGSCGDVPPEEIPCGESVAGKEGRTDKANDWDCPGEQRCCKSDDGCHSVCKEPPNVCENAAHDLAILIESSDSVGAAGFEKAKKFAKDIVNAFKIGTSGTHVSVTTFGASSSVNFNFNSFSGPQLTASYINENIDQIKFLGGSPAAVNAALDQAVNNVFSDINGAREGVNKSLVIIGSGQFQDPAVAIGLGAALKQNLVDVFAVPVGDNPDVATLRSFASPNVEKNVFMTSSHNALRPHVRAVTKAICDGAIKIRKCDRPVDVYFGIPVSGSVAPQFANIKKMFTSLLSLLKVNNRLVHTGLIRYSDTADVVLNLNRVYNRDAVGAVINQIPISGSSLNLARAFEVAADHGFTIYGGVRQTVPKIFVVYIPGPVSSPPAEVQAAVTKLKGLGVRVVLLGLDSNIDKSLYSTVSTQPSRKFVLTADSFAGLNLALNAAANRICNAKYGRCPKPPPAPPSCPAEDDLAHECSEDKDCKTEGDLCCQDGCKQRTCKDGVKNCFVPMEIAFALDVSETVSSQDFDYSRDFVKEMIRRFADSENDIHTSIMEFAGSARTLTPGFKKARSEADLRSVIDNMKKTNDPTRRVDLALKTAKKEIFSLEGYTRQGHPRYLVFVVSSATSADSGDLLEARKELDRLGVKTVAVGMSSNVDKAFLNQLASSSDLVFESVSAESLEKIRPQVLAGFCAEKPGQCPPGPVGGDPPDPAVCNARAEIIPCGDSAKKAGRSQRENDWDCPGEQKCCRDVDTGCFVCKEPPLECKKTKDIELIVESSDTIGKAGYERLKLFLQYFASAFSVSRDGAHIGMISFGSRSREEFRLSSFSDIQSVNTAIGKSRFHGGRYAVPTNALTTALDISLTNRGGARDNVNKSVVFFTTGQFDKPDTALAVAQQMKEELVDVYSVVIGDKPDLQTIRQLVSRPTEDNVFMMSSTDALRAQARALVKRVCDGAEKNLMVSIMPKVCISVIWLTLNAKIRTNGL